MRTISTYRKSGRLFILRAIAIFHYLSKRWRQASRWPTIRPELLTATWIIKQIPEPFLINTHAFRDWVPACKILKIADFNLLYTTSTFNNGVVGAIQGRLNYSMCHPAC